MRKISSFVSSVIIASSLASVSLSSNAAEVGSGPNPFSDCGIGAALFSDTKWAAVSSNVIWDIGTTAVTSALASPETCSGSKVEAAKFIIDNYDNIVEELAKGSGEHIASMYNTISCDTSKHSLMTEAIRKDVAELVSDESYQDKNLVEKSSDLYNALNNSSAAGSCALI